MGVLTIEKANETLDKAQEALGRAMIAEDRTARRLRQLELMVGTCRRDLYHAQQRVNQLHQLVGVARRAAKRRS